MSSDGAPYLGMHLFWWMFWIIAMVSVFGFNVPERARLNSADPLTILRRRLANGAVTEAQYSAIAAQLAEEPLTRPGLTMSIKHSVRTGHPIVDGLSFSVTWILSYSICTVLYWIAPDAMVSATSKLFHGMSFTQMAQTGASFGVLDFVSVLTLGAIYSFAVGVIWSLAYSFIYRHQAEQRLKFVQNQREKPTRLSA